MAIIKPMVLKLCAMTLDHKTAPIFISVYTLLGLALLSPWFIDLIAEGFRTLLSHPIALALCFLKGIIFWFATYEGQKLAKQSLSSAKYVLPPALALSAMINFFLGETLTLIEWVSVLGLAGIGTAFFLKGHMQDLGAEAKLLYFKLIFIAVSMIVIDHYTVTHGNWYVLLLSSNFTLLIMCLVQRSSIQLWKTALFNKAALAGGVSFVVFEVVKFYPMVTLIPVTVVSTVQAATIPIILVLSSLIWGERGWKEQLLWGVLSVILILPLIFF